MTIAGGGPPKHHHPATRPETPKPPPREARRPSERGNTPPTTPHSNPPSTRPLRLPRAYHSHQGRPWPPTAWDDGGARVARSWWRRGTIEDQMLPHRDAAARTVGDGPASVRDITTCTPWRGKVFKAYKITDIYSRKIVGWRVEDRELTTSPGDVRRRVHRARPAHGGAPDSGAAMTSNLLRDSLHEQGVNLSHNRPYTSNDNPFSEAGFRTMKYRPGYPKVFTNLRRTRIHRRLRPWYNHQHNTPGRASHPRSPTHRRPHPSLPTTPPHLATRTKLRPRTAARWLPRRGLGRTAVNWVASRRAEPRRRGRAVGCCAPGWGAERSVPACSGAAHSAPACSAPAHSVRAGSEPVRLRRAERTAP